MARIADPATDLLDSLIGHRLADFPQRRATLLVGLVGRGIQASRSPAMHEREAARLGIPYAYLLLDFDALGLADDALAAVVAGAVRAGFRGLNVTHPFKQAVLPHLDGLADEARAIGAVNTIVCADGRTTGHNTDSWGFTQSIRDGMRGAALDRVVQFGAGGAGAAVAHALLRLGVGELALIDTDRVRAESLARRLAADPGGQVTARSDVAAAMAAADGIVNTTPIGMAKYPGTPFPAHLLAPRHWVADIVYFPIETELLSRARDLGCRVLPGIGMAVGQAARAFALFSGREPDRAAMATHFRAAA